MDKFNENLKQFLDVIKTNYPDQKDNIDNYYIFDENTKSKYLDEFIKNCNEIGDDISTKNEIIFSKTKIVLNSIDFYSIWNDESLNEDQKDNIWKYLHTLYIFAFEHIKDNDFKTILHELKNIKNNDNLDNETKTFLNIVENLSNKYKNAPNNINADSETDNKKTNIPGIPSPDIFDGIIGNLAKEIASEIDPSSLNLDNPSVLLESLLSGNFDEKNDTSGVVNLVKNITDKIQDKLTSGNLNEDQLFSEAQNVMKKFTNTKDKNNPMNLFNSMLNPDILDGMNSEQSSIIKEAQNIINNKGVTNNNTPKNLEYKAKLKSRQEKLRKKLAKKKAELEKLQKAEKVAVKHEDIDLDALADEIEGL